MSYNIAYLAFEWNYEHQTAQLMGMEKYVKEHENVRIFTFNAVAKYLDEEVDKSALEILNLPDLQQYDGIMIQGNRMWKAEERQAIVDKAHALGIPVVSINYPLRYSTHIGTDNYMPIMDLMAGLKDKAQVKSTVFVCGYKNSEEAKIRQKAYLDACEKYDIYNMGCLEAGWNTEDGIRVGKAYLQSGKKLPDCFVCANDNTARSICDVLMKNGISIPDQVIVTGFDNQELAYAYLPRLTSIDRDYKQTGYLAIQSLVNIIEGKEMPKAIYTPYSIKWRLDGDANLQEDKKYWKRFVDVTQEVRNFSFIHSHFEPAMLTCSQMDDLCNVLEVFGKELHTKEIFFLLNQHYIENYDSPEIPYHSSEYIHLMAMHSSTLLPCDPRSHVYQTYPSKEILPKQLLKESALYIIYPIHFQKINIGYMVTNGVPNGSECGFVPVYLSLIETAFENVRRRNILHSINRKLDEMYVHDSLTGCYNRFGLEKYGEAFYNSCIQKDGKVYLLFADIDNMKAINDKYGHEYGDAAIRTSALLLKEAMQNTGMIVRYGGDEFLMILSVKYHEKSLQIEDYPLMIENEEVRLCLSIGEVCITNSIPFSSAIEQADQLMYKIKKCKKIMRGI